MKPEELEELINKSKQKKKAVEGKAIDPVEELSPIDLYKMQQREKQYAALLGGSKRSDDDEDAVSKEIAKAIRDLRQRAAIKALKDDDGGSKETSEIRLLRERLDQLEKDRMEDRRKHEAELQKLEFDRKLETFKNEILSAVGNKKEPNVLDEINKRFDRLQEDTNGKKIENDNKKEVLDKLDMMSRLTQNKISQLENRISSDARLYGGEPPKGFKDFIKELKEQKEIMTELGMIKESVAKGDENVLETLLDKAPKVSESIRSIHDMWTGREDDDVDDRPDYTPPSTGLQDNRLHTQPIAPDLEAYFRQGRIEKDPETGKEIWSDPFGIAPTDATGRMLPAAEVEQLMRLQPEQIRRFRNENRANWEIEMQKAKAKDIMGSQTTAPPEEPSDEEEQTESDQQNIEIDTEQQEASPEQEPSTEDVGFSAIGDEDE